MEFRKLFRIIFVAMVIAGLVLASGAMASSPAAGGDDNKVVSKRVRLSETRMLTAGERRKAKPAPMPEFKGKPVFEEAAALPSGPAEMVPGGLGEGKGSLSVDLLGGAEQEPLPTWKERHYLYPPPYTRYKLLPYSLYTVYPYRTIGKVFFKIPRHSGTYTCSGGVAVGRAVWTAGHCVYTKGYGWHTNVIFCPSYKAGKTPYGCWSAFVLGTLNGWIAGKQQYDIGMIGVSDKAGKKISQRVGWLGAMWNKSPRQHWHALGYPSARPFNGKYKYICAASKAVRDNRFGSPWTNGMGCDQTPGCSGGPWLVKFKPKQSGANNYVNGVFSYFYTAQRKQLFSPYFGTGAKNMYNMGKGW